MNSQIYKEVLTYTYFTSLQDKKCKYNRLLVIDEEPREQMRGTAETEETNLSPFLVNVLFTISVSAEV